MSVTPSIVLFPISEALPSIKSALSWALVLRCQLGVRGVDIATACWYYFAVVQPLTYNTSCCLPLLHRADEARRKKESAAAAFKELLVKANLKATSQWRKVSAKLQDEEVYETLDRMTRLEVFQAHIRQLEEEEKQQREKEKEVKRRKVSLVFCSVCQLVIL